MNKSLLCVLTLLTLLGAARAADEGRFFGLTPPRGTPQSFAPPVYAHLVREPRVFATSLAFSPYFRRCVFTVVDARDPQRVSVQAYETTQKNGEWSEPVILETITAGGHSAGEVIFDRDGRWLYYSSSRPPGRPGLAPRIFRAAVRDSGLGLPEHVPIEPPSGGTFYPRPLAGGVIAFTAPGPVGRDDLFLATPRAGGYQVQPMDGDFNSPQDDWDLVETRDGNLRVWASARPGGRGRTDLWFSRRDAAGHWSEARNFTAVNSPELETAPQFSPDDAVLFFLSRKSGTEQMYWVDLASILEPAP